MGKMQNGKLSDRQFGFRNNTATVAVTDAVTSKIKANKDSKLHFLIVALDISNALNSAWPTKLELELKNHECLANIGMLVCDFLRQVDLVCGSSAKCFCPEGSSLCSLS